MSEETAQGSTTPGEHRAAHRLLLHTASTGGPWLALLAATTVALAAVELALPAVLGQAVNAVLGDASDAWIVWSAVLVGALILCDALDDLAAGAAIARSTARLRHRFVGHVLALGMGAAERFGPGDLATRAGANAGEAGRVGPDAIRIAANVIPSVGGVVALALIDPWLAVTFLAGLPLFVLLVRAFARDASDLAAAYLRIQGTIAARLSDALAGARTIAAAGTAEREAQRVLAPLPELHRTGIGMWRAQRRFTTQDAVLVPLLEVAVLSVAGVELAHGRISPGQFLAASQYVFLAATVGSAITSVTRLVRERAAAARVAEVVEEPAVEYGGEEVPQGPGRIEFRGVTVRGDGAPALDAVDLIVPGGSLVALAGPSGAGKTLLAALAGRLADPDEGEVLIDGVPLPRLDRAALRRAVGYGFEEPNLFGATIADAVAFGMDPPPEEQVMAAARAARADGFIRRLPGGYRTPLAEAPMSGGETQRVGLARTFAHAKRVVILDDVAASLDTVTEHQISEVLTGTLAGSTRIVVAHRASTAARSDLVVWLDRGRVRTVGSHDELWRDPAYRRLFGAPASGAATNGDRPAGG